MARILFITQTAHPWGGVETWLEGLTAGLARDHEVILGLVRGARFHDPDRYRAARRRQLPSIEISSLTGTPEGRRRALAEAIDSTGADVLVPVNIADVLEVVRRKKEHGSLIRLFYPLHALLADYLGDVRSYSGVIDLALVTNRLAERALINISGMEHERVDYVWYGVPPPLRAPTFNCSGPLRLVFCGRFQQELKRVRDLVPLCAELDRRGIAYSLDIAGDGEEDPFLRSALSQNPNVHFLGLLSRERLYEMVYPGAHAMLILSASETGPIVAWEAMIHGATLVTTAYRGLRAEGRIVNEANALIAEVGDVPALAGAVQRLSGDRALLERLRRSAFENMSEACDFEQSLANWRRAFEHGLLIPAATAVSDERRGKAAGRLDRILGASLAETIRAVAGRGMIHDDPGAEWPHTLGHAEDASAIDAAVVALDR